jgi:hypothetical protein
MGWQEGNRAASAAYMGASSLLGGAVLHVCILRMSAPFTVSAPQEVTL